MSETTDQDDVIIATIDGEQAEAQAKQFFPQAQLFSAPHSASFSTLFMNVTTGKADLTIAEPASVLAFLDNNPDNQIGIRSQYQGWFANKRYGISKNIRSKNDS